MYRKTILIGILFGIIIGDAIVFYKQKQQIETLTNKCKKYEQILKLSNKTTSTKPDTVMGDNKLKIIPPSDLPPDEDTL